MEKDKPNIDIEKIINHYKESSEDDFNTMISLYNSKSYNWSLFIGHITLEKLIKALYVKINNEHAPYTHNLLRLIQNCNVEIQSEYLDWLDEITSFNINARYNDFKKEFYNKCTKSFTNEWIEKIKKLKAWINQML